MLNQIQIKKLSAATLTDIRAIVGGINGDRLICFCAATGTMYRYVTAGSAFGADNSTSVLATGDGGNTRWIGIAGTYNHYVNTTSGLAATDIQAGIDELTKDISPQRTYFVSPSFTDNTSTRRFSTITAARNHARTQSHTQLNPGAICVYTGIYIEELVWDLPCDYVHLISPGSSAVVLVGQNAPAFDLRVSHCEVRNITFLALGSYPTVRVSGIGLNSALTLCNELRTDMISHFANATRHTTGQQSTAGFNAACTDLTTLLALSGQLLTAYATHNADAILPSGWAYHNQRATTKALVSAVTPTTLVQAITRLTDLKAKYNDHEDETVGHNSTVSVVADQTIAANPAVGNYYAQFWDCFSQGTGSSDHAFTFAPSAFALCYRSGFYNVDETVKSITVENNAETDAQFYQCFVNGKMSVDGGSIRAVDTETRGTITMNDSSNLTAFVCRCSTISDSVVIANTIGNFTATGCEFVSGGGYDTVVVTAQPTSGAINTCSFRYSGTSPTYSVRADINYLWTGTGNTFARGNGSATGFYSRNILTTSRDVGHSGSTTYRLISDANLAAAVGDSVVLDDANDYTGQVTLKSGVNYFSKSGIPESCIVTNASSPILFASGFTGCLVKGIKFVCSTAGADMMDLPGLGANANKLTFDNCIFLEGILKHSAPATAGTYNIQNCQLQRATVTSTVLDFTQISANGPHEYNITSNYIYGRSIWAMQNATAGINCYITKNTLIGRTDFSCYASAGNVYLTFSNNQCQSPYALALLDNTGVVNVLAIDGNNCSSIVGPIFYFRKGPNWQGFMTKNYMNTAIPGLGAEIWIDTCTVDTSIGGGSFVFEGNVLYGVECVNGGKFYFGNAIKNVMGGKDCFTTLWMALLSTRAGDTIVLNDNTVPDGYWSTQYWPTACKFTIQGNGYSITETNAPLFICNDAAIDVTFKNVVINGSIGLTLGKVTLDSDCVLNGCVNELAGGTTSTKLTARMGAKLLGTTTYHNPILISDADPTTLCDGAYIKGYTGYGAIYWNNVNNNSVQIKNSTILHGSLSTNNPFENTGTLTVSYKSHHNLYNSDPELNPEYTNAIAAAYDVYSINGDY